TRGREVGRRRRGPTTAGDRHPEVAPAGSVRVAGATSAHPGRGTVGRATLVAGLPAAAIVVGVRPPLLPPGAAHLARTLARAGAALRPGLRGVLGGPAHRGVDPLLTGATRATARHGPDRHRRVSASASPPADGSAVPGRVARRLLRGDAALIVAVA